MDVYLGFINQKKKKVNIYLKLLQEINLVIESE